MPIMDVNNLQVVLGTGDIAIKTGCKGNYHPGVIQFEEVEPSLIGQRKHIGNNEKIKADEAPVTLVFNKIESLDVVINQLLKLREVMGGNRDARSIS
ncbi:MAG: hypothetical protein ABTA16_08320 [Niallia sp.]